MTIKRSEESVLIRKCKHGDKDAWQRLVDAHQANAYRFAFRLARDQDDAEDIVIDSFLRVHRALNTFSGSSAFSTWMYQIIRNCYLDLRRKKARSNHLSLDCPWGEEGALPSLELASTKPSPLDYAMISAQSREMTRAIDGLAPHCKAIILMYHTQMLSYEEIAEVLETPVGTVKSRLNRARLQLRDSLETKRMLFVGA